MNTVGPHRDDLVVRSTGGRRAPHASQGEQRCLALPCACPSTRWSASAPELRADPAPRRRLLRARPFRSRALVAELPGRPVHPHHGAPATGRGSRWRRCPWRWAERVTPGEGAPIGGPRARGRRRCPRCSAGSARPRPASAMEAVFARWDEVAGADLAATSGRCGWTGATLVVAVDHPAWATRARMQIGPDPGAGAGPRATTTDRASSSLVDAVPSDRSECRIGTSIG